MNLMTQTILDTSLSLDGFATASNVRVEEPMGDGQGWVYAVVDDVHRHYERAAGRSKSSTSPTTPLTRRSGATAPAIAKETCGASGR
jgi:hypothetical protein